MIEYCDVVYGVLYLVFVWGEFDLVMFVLVCVYECYLLFDLFDVEFFVYLWLLYVVL